MLPVEELGDAVAWESEPLLPFVPDKAYLDWMVLKTEAGLFASTGIESLTRSES